MRPERVELPTYGFVVRRSIQLSYGRRLGSVAQTFLASGSGTEAFENCFELIEVDGLEEVIFDAFLHGLDDDASVCNTGHDQDVTGRLTVADFGNELEPLDVRHQEVEANQVEVLGFHQAQDFAGIRNGHRPVPMHLQPSAHNGKNVGFVINEKYSHCCKNGKGVTRGGARIFVIRAIAPPGQEGRLPLLTHQEQPLVDPQFRHL